MSSNAERQREWRKRNPRKSAEYSRRWAKNNPEKRHQLKQRRAKRSQGRPRSHLPWSEADLKLLAEFQGTNWELATQLQRSESSVRSMKTRVKQESARKKERGRQRWTNYEFKLLKEFQGTDLELADKLERSVSAVKRMRIKVRAGQRGGS